MCIISLVQLTNVYVSVGWDCGDLGVPYLDKTSALLISINLWALQFTHIFLGLLRAYSNGPEFQLEPLGRPISGKKYQGDAIMENLEISLALPSGTAWKRHRHTHEESVDYCRYLRSVRWVSWRFWIKPRTHYMTGRPIMNGIWSWGRIMSSRTGSVSVGSVVVCSRQKKLHSVWCLKIIILEFKTSLPVVFTNIFLNMFLHQRLYELIQ